MTKRWDVVYLIVAVLVALVVLSGVGWYKSYKAEATLVETQGRCETLEAKAAYVIKRLCSLGVENNELRESLLIAKEEKSKAEDDRVGLEAEILALKDQQSLELDEARKTAWEAGYDEGLGEGRISYEELTDFLGGLTLLYLAGKPICCVDSAAALNAAAEGMGYRGVSVVFLVYSYPNGGKWGHFINSFGTTDKGLVFVEPDILHIVEGVEVGKIYPYGQKEKIREIIFL